MLDTDNLHDDAAVLDQAETLKGDLLTFLLDRIKHMPKPWQQMPAEEQQGYINALDDAVAVAIRKMVRTIATQGRTVILADCATVNNDGKKIVAKLTISTHDANRHDLLDAVGDQVLLIVGSDAADYMGGDKPEADPDQPGLPMGDEEMIDDDKPVFDSTSHGEPPGRKAKPRGGNGGGAVV